MVLKKLFRWAGSVALAMAGTLLVQSCNEVLPVNRGAVYLNTASLYEELGITDLMTEELENSECFVLADLLIYDKSGKLVFGQEIETAMLTALPLEVSGLAEGEYTIVAFQTTVTPAREEAVDWKLEGVEDIRTAAVLAIDEAPLTFTSAIGYASTTVSIHGDYFEAFLTPKAMGGIVEIQIDNFTYDSGYSFMTLGFRPENYCYGFYLDPARSDEDRWVVIEETVKYSKIIGFAYPDKPAGRYFTMTHGENIPLTLIGFFGEAGEVIAEGNYTLALGGNFLYYFDLDN